MYRSSAASDDAATKQTIEAMRLDSMFRSPGRRRPLTQTQRVNSSRGRSPHGVETLDEHALRIAGRVVIRQLRDQRVAGCVVERARRLVYRSAGRFDDELSGAARVHVALDEREQLATDAAALRARIDRDPVELPRRL